MEKKIIIVTLKSKKKLRIEIFIFFFRAKLQTGFSFLTAQETITKQLTDIEFPFLVMHGTNDKTIPIAASENLFKKSKTQENSKKFTKYEGACHDLLHDPDTNQVIQEILDWSENMI